MNEEELFKIEYLTKRLMNVLLYDLMTAFAKFSNF